MLQPLTVDRYQAYLSNSSQRSIEFEESVGPTPQYTIFFVRSKTTHVAKEASASAVDGKCGSEAEFEI